jgi:hypothetical protein
VPNSRAACPFLEPIKSLTSSHHPHIFLLSVDVATSKFLFSC